MVVAVLYSGLWYVDVCKNTIRRKYRGNALFSFQARMYGCKLPKVIKNGSNDVTR